MSWLERFTGPAGLIIVCVMMSFLVIMMLVQSFSLDRACQEKGFEEQIGKSNGYYCIKNNVATEIIPNCGLIKCEIIMIGDSK
jgi:hypothetical protein